MDYYGSLVIGGSGSGDGTSGGTVDIPIKAIKVNGEALVPVNKVVNIEVPEFVSELEDDKTKELTKAEYEALSDIEKANGVSYYCTDTGEHYLNGVLYSGSGNSGGGTIDAYTKQQTDDLLLNKADKDTVYTKTDTDVLLGDKVDRGTTYTKTEADVLLDDKADKGTTYTKTEVEALITNKVAEIVAGAPEDFNTLKEMSTWIDTHEEDASKMNLSIQENAGAIAESNEALGKNILATSENTEAISGTKEDVAINTSSIGLRRKNLLKNTTGTKTEGGVSFTVNADGSVTAKVTGTHESNAYYLINKISLKKGKYIYTGGNSEDRNKPYILVYTYKSDNTYIGAISGDTGFEVTDETMKYGFNINYPTGNSDEVTFYPMLRFADITDDTYAPYVDDLQTQIAKNDNDIAITQSSIGLSKKNLLQPTSTVKRAGVTYTVNADGSVSLTGKSTATTTYNYFSIPFTLKAGRYKVSGMPYGSSDSTYRVDIRANESGGTVHGYGSSEFEFELTQTTTAYYMIRIAPAYAEEFTGLTFYPMIRYADITDGTYEPYTPDLQTQVSINQSSIGLSKKNLLKNIATTKTINNEITFTVNDDKSVTVNGTNTSSDTVYLELCGLVDYGERALTASIGTIHSGVYLAIYDSNWNWIGTGTTGIITWDNKGTRRVRLVVRSGATINNATFYPMIRYADIADSTYEPYTPDLQTQITALQTGVYLYNKSDYATFTDGYVMRIGNQVHLNCKLKVTKAMAQWVGNVIKLPFAVKTPNDVERYTVKMTQTDGRETSIYLNKGGVAFYTSTAFNVGDIIEVKGLILDMYVEEATTTTE